MNQFKRAKVIMLPTNDISNLCLGNNLSYVEAKNEKTLSQIWEYLKQSFPYKPQHLYIISDDEIKEGDWIYNNKENIVEQITSKTELIFVLEENKENQTFKKIIATTDTSIIYRKGFPHNPIDGFADLPQPSQQFIEKYIEEYNKGNIITDVLVEYELGLNNIPGDYNNILSLKINPKDNTITIKKVKDSWNREEVKSLISKAFSSDLINNQSATKLDKWIEENL